MKRRRQLRALVCRGPNCRGKAQEKLCAALDDAGIAVDTTRCLGVCKGPVALLLIDDRWEVVSRIRGKRARQRALAAVTESRKRTIRSRSVRGARRRRALSRGAKFLR